MIKNVVGIRYKNEYHVYNFIANELVLNVGDIVIVDTEQGLTLGQVVRGPRSFNSFESEDKAPHILHQDTLKEKNGEITKSTDTINWSLTNNERGGITPFPAPVSNILQNSIRRLATAEDLSQAEANTYLEAEAYIYCQKRIVAYKLNMKLVKVASLFDSSKIIFYFTAEHRLDFRELVKNLAARFHRRIELRQISVRQETKLLGSIGSCSRELCCATFLKKIIPVSVKMAKEQNLSLNPTKISGICGRLMCCLTYEYENC